jgi:aromatic-L-amino-acid/L-tryptophan decarboxylase
MQSNHRTSSGLPLDLDVDAFRNLVNEAAVFLAEYLQRLPQTPVWCATGGSYPENFGPAEHGRPLPELLSILRAASQAGSCNASGGFMAFIPNGGLGASAVADLISDVLNKYTGVNFTAPGLVALERDLLRWIVQVMGLPQSAACILTSGASLATVSALACVRESKVLQDLRAATIYLTDQTHSALAKAARLVGFPRASLRHVAVDSNQRMDVLALEDLLRADRAAGRVPLCIVATAGSINSGAVDPLAALADIAARERMWMHVDAAYGGFFRLTQRGQAKLAGMERADSVVLDPHKGLFLPFGTGCLIVRDEAVLRRAHAEDEAAYRRDIPAGGSPSFAEITPELTRPYRGLRLWLPLHLHGVAAFRQTLDAHLDFARRFHEELSRMPGVEVQSPPELSVVAFRLRTDAATEALVKSINDAGRVMISTTRIHERTYARAAFLNHRTRQHHVDALLEEIGQRSHRLTPERSS